MTKQEIVIHLTTYEHFLESLVLKPNLPKSETVEKINFTGELNPIDDLNTLFFLKKKYMNFDEFFSYYLQNHKTQLHEIFKNCNIEREEFLLALESRIYRTQCGVLTEYYAYYLAKLIFPSDDVIRDLKWDKIGVDFRIKYGDKIYNIHIFIDSASSNKYREVKQTYRGANSLDGVHVDFPYTMRPNRVHSARILKNGFGVYTLKYFKYLRGEMEKGNMENKTGINANGFVYAIETTKATQKAPVS